MQTGIDILMKMVGLHAIRKKKGYSQLKVAMDLSISREAISYYENGLRCPNLEMLVNCPIISMFQLTTLLQEKISANSQTNYFAE